MVIQVVLGYVVGVLAALATLYPRRWGLVGAVAVLAYAVWVLAGQPGSRQEGVESTLVRALGIPNASRKALFKAQPQHESGGGGGDKGEGGEGGCREAEVGKCNSVEDSVNWNEERTN